MKVFRIRSSATGEYWSTRKGKTFWLRKGRAKAAWVRGTNTKIDECECWDIIEFTLVESEELLELIKKSAKWELAKMFGDVPEEVN